MAAADQVTLVIEGLPEEDGRVRLGVFMSQLQSLSATVAKLDRDANNGKAAVYYRITELSYSSPVRVVIEPHPLPKQSDTGPVIIESLQRVAIALENGSDLSALDADLLEDIRALARPVGKTVKNTTLLFNGHRLDLTPRIAAKVDQALAVDDECDGGIEGMLEQINIHHGANTFHIYPAVGPRKVTCHFPARLYDDAVSAVGKRVEVFGSLRYRIGASFPHEIAVSGIEEFPPESELPDWEDLRGRAPEATGSLSSEAFIRELRSAWR
ncbi:MAG: hypothetical protein WCE26_01845 [Candidatus Acidiferrales bacterium]